MATITRTPSYLMSVDFTKYQAGTSMPALNQWVLSLIVFGRPLLAEQHRIVTKIDELMAFRDTLKTCIQETEASRTHLTNAVVARATVG